MAELTLHNSVFVADYDATKINLSGIVKDEKFVKSVGFTGYTYNGFGLGNFITIFPRSNEVLVNIRHGSTTEEAFVAAMDKLLHVVGVPESLRVTNHTWHNSVAEDNAFVKDVLEGAQREEEQKQRDTLVKLDAEIIKLNKSLQRVKDRRRKAEKRRATRISKKIRIGELEVLVLKNRLVFSGTYTREECQEAVTFINGGADADGIENV
jgi:hypothetical protein